MKFKFDKELPRIRRTRKVVKTRRVKQVREVEDVIVDHEQVGRDVARQVEEASQGQISLGEDGGSYSGELEEY